MPLTVHDYVTGRPSRAKSFSDFIAYAKQFEGVVFTTHEDVVSWWREGGNQYSARIGNIDLSEEIK